MLRTDTSVTQAVFDAARPITGAAEDFDPLLERIGDARFVLIGEASHGTHEFYATRARITRRLIEERGFTAVAIEADWPDAWRVNRWVRGHSSDVGAERALAGFERFPTWMWRNQDVLEFVEWLREHNRDAAVQAGFYGLDLYSLYGSIAAVLDYLQRVDPDAARRARSRYACFEQFQHDVQAYGHAAHFDVAASCEDEAVRQLVELQAQAARYEHLDGQVARDEFFHAEQNARLVRDAERYYRTMFGGRVASWNQRDRHMADTLDALVGHLDRDGWRTRVVVWEHNSHLGDARATEAAAAGELNVGQLVRERHAGDAYLIGFTTFAGSVTAASDWDGPAERKRVRPALAGSWERLFHETAVPRFELDLADPRVRGPLSEPRLERAIGVIYRPETERLSHYFDARLAMQFDSVIHFDHTTALTPLERAPRWETGEPPETYPMGV